MTAHHIAWLAGFQAAIVVAAVSAADEPYEAYVLTDQAEIVAGPGHRYYITDKLARGTKVEIYREEQSGWLAIRPPDGSFSWIPADFVERLDEGLGKIKEPTAAWVGTSIEHVAKHHEQLTLKPGELISILSEKSTTAKSGSQQTWLKIAPPAGEFRWIHLRDVSRQKPPEQPSPPPVESVVANEEAASEHESSIPREEPRRIQLLGEAIALESIDDGRTRREQRIEPAQFRQTIKTESTTLSPDGFVPRKRRDAEAAASMPSTPTRSASKGNVVSTATAAPIRQPANEDRLASLAPRTSPVPISSAPLADQDFRRQLDQIELDLSLMLSQDRAQWDFAALEQRVQALVESGADPAARGRARLVQDKLQQFKKSFAAGDSPARTTATPKFTSTSTNTLADPRYDAHGILKEVISRKSARPAAPYAVVDAEGQPLCFVTPSPGLNLNRYLNKQVGLYGRRGYLEELKKPHVVAERVIEVERR